MKHISRVAKRIRVRRGAALFAAIAVAMLALTGGALAWHGFSSETLVSVTFSANSVANSQSETCTAANNDSIQVTQATFTGTASSSDTHLAGPVTIHATSVYDATTSAGTVSGDLAIGTGFQGHFVTVNARGTLQGMLAGQENGAGQLLANLSSSFTTTGGFGSSSSLATVGSGTATNTAIVSTSGCAGGSTGDDNDDDRGQDHQGQTNFSGAGTFSGHSTFGGLSSQHHHSGGDNRD